MMKTLIIFVSIVGIFAQTGADDAAAAKDEPFNSFSQFTGYMNQYGKVYNSMDEYATKFNNFQINSANIDQLNSVNDADSVTFSHTAFSDLHPDDFRSQFLAAPLDADAIAQAQNLGFVSSKNITDPNPIDENKNLRNLVTVPTSWDWRTKGVVGPVKNQLQCGSCWSFASSANIESMYAIKYGVLHNFSEQQLMDCNSSNYACLGGNMANAFVYIENSSGLETTYNYGSYLSYKSNCRSNTNLGLAQVVGYKFIGNNEVTIKNYLYQYGPLAVTLNATPLQYYSSGIINLNAAGCDPTNLDHAVMIVGYGTSNGLNYWIVKNSWGPYWGESGYFRIVRGYGVCGINSYVITAVIG